MENQNFIPAETLDPRDQQIVDLERQLEHYRGRDQLKAEQFDQLGDALMGVIGDKLEAVIENAMNDFDIHDYQGDIDDMIDDRLPSAPDEDDHREAVEAIVRDILSGATVTIDV